MQQDPTLQLQALHDDLDLLKNAIETEDHDTAEQIVASHDQRLRHYIHTHGVGAAAGALQALQALLAQQQAVTMRMRELRDQAAAQLRSERQSNRAASAYVQAGTLA